MNVTVDKLAHNWLHRLKTSDILKVQQILLWNLQTQLHKNS